MSPKIYVILLNWNGKKDTEECLNSLKKLNYDNYNIIVVDNGSKDDSVNYLKQRFPDVYLICNAKNYGFAEGNNIGIKYALKQGAEYVLLLNNDTILDSELLLSLVETASKKPDIAIVSPKIYNYYNPDKIESSGFIIKPILSKIVPIGYGYKDIGQYNEDKEISFASGCAMFIKTSAITSEIFDANYFAYCEDMDFCYNLLKKGYKIYYSYKSKVWHKVSASTGGYKSPLSVYLFTKNRIRFAKKNLSFFQRLFFYAYLSAYVPAFIAVNIKRNELSVVKNFIKGLISAYSKKFSNSEFTFEPYYNTIGINARYLQRAITGIERYALELIKNLSKIDEQNKYVLFFNRHEKFMNPVNELNFKQYITRIPTQIRILRVFWEQFWLANEIKSNSLDIFHGPSFLTPLSKKCKYITTIHDLSFFRYPESFTLENKLYFKFFLKRSIHNSDLIIADSNSTKNDIIHYFGIPENKIRTIYLGVDETFKHITDQEKLLNIKKKYSLPDKFILFIGVLSPRKNVERTLEAFNSLKKQGYPHKFVVVGKKGWLYETIFERIKSLNLQEEVIFTDYVREDDLSCIYNLADLFILASLYEGFGLPILEAMACGCPVVTANVSSMPEVAGDATILVNPLSVEEIEYGMKRVLSDNKLREELILKGFKQAKKFTWMKTAEETLKVYKELREK